MAPVATWIGAREVQSLGAGGSVDVDPDAEGIASPTPFATVPAGDYEVQAVLDVNHSYNYKGRGDEGLGEPCGFAAALDARRGRGTWCR